MGLGIRLGLLELAVMVSVWISLAAPDEMPVRLTVCKLAFSLIVRSLRASSVGAWLTALTVTMKYREMMLLLVPPSLTVTVMTAVPKARAAGAKVRVPVELGLV